ncbi:MAG: hypothetical protein K6C68_08285, partial [Ruminococcus sp.]|nr:hypothetical protein [Ruminococcus sp.]
VIYFSKLFPQGWIFAFLSPYLLGGMFIVIMPKDESLIADKISYLTILIKNHLTDQKKVLCRFLPYGGSFSKCNDLEHHQPLTIIADPHFCCPPTADKTQQR